MSAPAVTPKGPSTLAGIFGPQPRPSNADLSIAEIVAVYDAYSAAITMFVNIMNQARVEDIGQALLDDEVDRLDSIKDGLLDELRQRRPADSWEADLRLRLFAAAALDAENWPEVARLSALAAGAH